MKIRLILTGRGYDAARLPAEVELPDGATLAAALAHVEQLSGGHKLAASTLVIVSGRHLGTIAAHEDIPLADGDEIMLLQPVAGG